MGFCELALCLMLVGQIGADLDVASVDDTADERLAYMQACGATYKVTIGDEKQPASFVKVPIQRFTNPVSGLVDGGLFLWQDNANRPVAVAQLFIAPKTERLWIHEFQSLSEQPLRFEYNGKAVWTPSAPGVVFKPMDGAPVPAETAVARRVQMGALARRFSIKDDFEGASKDQLRLLSKPLVRYADKTASDGAPYAYAHGTDPELLILLEARRPNADDAPVWHVALAPMTAYAITAELDDEEYWQVEWRQAPHPITAIFTNFVFPPEQQPSLFQQLFNGQ